MNCVSFESLCDLLKAFAACPYSAANPGDMGDAVLTNVLELIGLDYTFTLVDNTEGVLNSMYPAKMVLVEGEVGQRPSTPRWDPSLIQERIQVSKFARCRKRFPFPSIFISSRNLSGSDSDEGMICVCRSGTVNDDDSTNEAEKALFRGADAGLLEEFQVGTIFNLMFEGRKIKRGVYTTSSETEDPYSAYTEFDLVSLPFPDCEFFSKYGSRKYDARDWKFDWNKPQVAVRLAVPWDEGILKDYLDWDVPTLTKNYLNFIMEELRTRKNGILIHCISGWDRTPAIIALVRLLLWAEGEAHPSLSPLQMTYLTVGYDWYLFGHRLDDRLRSKKEIMYFCYDFINYLLEDFDIDDEHHRKKFKKLSEVRRLFHDAYTTSIGLKF